MQRRVVGLLIASLSVLGALAPVASGSANTNGACVAQFTSNSAPGDVAATVTVLAQEERPFGVNVVSFGTPGKPSCEE